MSNTPHSQQHHRHPLLAEHFLPPINALSKNKPLRWLVLGFKDMAQAPGLSLPHGFVLALVGAVITALAHDRFWLLVGALSGFWVVATVLATSLYAMSRAMERQEAVNMGLLFNTWTQRQMRERHEAGSYWSLIRFGLLLGLAATGWVVTSAALITWLSPLAIHTPLDFWHHVVLAKQGHLFELRKGLGTMMTLPFFASSVVAMPLLLDRRVTVWQAVLSGWKAVLTHPFAMTLWAFLILLVCLLGMGAMFLGLIVAVPVLGHTSWHAYRDLLDVSELPERLPAQGWH